MRRNRELGEEGQGARGGGTGSLGRRDRELREEGQGARGGGTGS